MYAKTHTTTATSNAEYAAVQEYDEEQHHGGTLEGGATQMTTLTSSMPTAVLVVPAHLVDALPGDYGDGAPPELEDLPIHQKRLLFVWVIIASVHYGLFVLSCLIWFVMGIMIFDRASTFAINEVISFSLAALMVYAIVLMWRKYNRREYKKVLFLSLIPILLTLASTIYM
jgi:ABC-type Na+ efflux pump permease subunit